MIKKIMMGSVIIACAVVTVFAAHTFVSQKEASSGTSQPQNKEVQAQSIEDIQAQQGKPVQVAQIARDCRADDRQRPGIVNPAAIAEGRGSGIARDA